MDSDAAFNNKQFQRVQVPVRKEKLTGALREMISGLSLSFIWAASPGNTQKLVPVSAV